MTCEQHDLLHSHGVIVDHQYPQNAYVCKVEPAIDLAWVQGLPFIRHVSAFPPQAVLSHALQSKQAKRDPVDVAIILHAGSGSTSSEVLTEVSRIVHATNASCGSGIIFATIPANGAIRIAEIDDIRAIELRNTHASSTLKACELMEVYDPRSSTRETCTGQGETLAVCDVGGLGDGDIKKLPAVFETRVLDLVMRKEDLSVTREPALLDDPTGHGTHVSACAVGHDIDDGNDNGPDKIDTNKAVSGTAPGAQLFHIKKHPLVGVEDLLDLKVYSTTTKLPTVSNSWAFNYHSDDKKQEPYDEQDSLVVDKLMFRDPSLLLIFSAGNDGLMRLNTNAQICSTAASKNALVVGACASLRGFKSDPTAGRGQDAAQICSDPNAPVLRSYIPNFSNIGPTQGGVLKPDVVAPGVAILSSRSSAISETDLENLEQKYGKSGDARFIYASGTSQAAPLVAGCVASLRQACRGARPSPLPEPSGPLLKALIVNGTNSLVGGSAMVYDPNDKTLTKKQVEVELQNAPDCAQGYGMVNLRRSLEPVSSKPTSTKGYVDFPGFQLRPQPPVNVDLAAAPAPPAPPTAPAPPSSLATPAPRTTPKPTPVAPEVIAPVSPVVPLSAPQPLVAVEDEIWSYKITVPSKDHTVRATLAYNDREGAAIFALFKLELQLDNGEPVQPRQASPWRYHDRDIQQPKLKAEPNNLQKIVWRYNAETASPSNSPPRGGTLSVRVKRLDARSSTVSFAVVWWVTDQEKP